MKCIPPAMSSQGPPTYLLSWKIIGDTKRALFSIPQSDNLWYAETKTPTDKGQNIDPWQWNMPPRMVELQRLSVHWNPSMTLGIPGYNTHVKSLDFLNVGPKLFDKTFQRQQVTITQREIYTCEFLQRHPHPTLCSYRGVTVDRAGVVSALLFDRYDRTLSDMVRDRERFDADSCLGAVEVALKHLHSLGYIHYDPHPGNIFYSYRSRQFVLGDFDTAQFIGTQLQVKYGAPGWRPALPDGRTTPNACAEHDWYGFEVLKFWLKKKGNGRANKGDRLPSTEAIVKEATELLRDSNLALACM